MDTGAPGIHLLLHSGLLQSGPLEAVVSFLCYLYPVWERDYSGSSLMILVLPADLVHYRPEAQVYFL